MTDETTEKSVLRSNKMWKIARYIVATFVALIVVAVLALILSLLIVGTVILWREI